MVDDPGWLGNKLMLPGGFPWGLRGRSSAALGHYVMVYYVQIERTVNGTSMFVERKYFVFMRYEITIVEEKE